MTKKELISTVQNVKTKTKRIANYLYGTGSKTNNIPLEPDISDYDVDTSKFKLAGWASSSSATPSTWVQQWYIYIHDWRCIIYETRN